MKRTAARRRKGMSLLHLLGTFAVLSVIISFSGVMIARMSRAHHSLRVEMAGDIGLSRLLAELRREVHSATAAVVAGDTLRLELPAGEVREYRVRDSRLERLETRNAADAAVEAVVESAGLPAGPAAWRVEGRLVSLAVDAGVSAQVDFSAALGAALVGRSREDAP